MRKIAASAIALLLTGSVQAAPVTFSFEGEVVAARGVYVGQGTQISGTFSFDDQLVDSRSESTWDFFQASNPANTPYAPSFQASFTVGSITTSLESRVDRFAESNVTAFDSGSDSLWYYVKNSDTNGRQSFAIEANGPELLYTGSGNLNNSIANIIDLYSGLDLSKATSKYGIFMDETFGVGTVSFLQFNWTSVSRVTGHVDPDPIEVPEPTTLVLLGMGVIGLGVARRRMA